MSYFAGRLVMIFTWSDERVFNSLMDLVERVFQR